MDSDQRQQTASNKTDPDIATQDVDLSLLHSSLGRSVESRLRTNMAAANAAIELRNALHGR